MEMILINDQESNIVLYLNNKAFYGYKFYNDNRVEKLDYSVFKYFDFLRPSNNYTKLGIDNGYQVILDNNTNLKHYIKNGSFDIIKFFQNNGESIIRYNDNNEEIDKEYKLIRIYNAAIKTLTSICIAMSSIILVDICDLYTSQNDIYNIKNVIDDEDTSFLDNIEFEDLTKEDISKMINDSNSINKKAKAYLNNEDLFEDILPYVNDSNYMKYMYNKKFNQIGIEMFDDFPCKVGFVSGYYNPLEPNIIHLRNKSEEHSYPEDDTIAHEFIHLCQLSGKRNNIIEEATAEMYSYEYFDNTSMDTYNDQIKVVKKLMEIIGTEPIKRYLFSGDFSYIEQSVKPYLTDKEYKSFLEELHCGINDDFDNTKLNELLATLYNRIYNDDINNNKIISLIDENNSTLVRYYFNPRLIDKEHSYYYSVENPEQLYFTYDQAYEKGLIEYIPIINEENGTLKDYKVKLVQEGYIDYANKQVMINVPSKVYLNPIQENNYNIRK